MTIHKRICQGFHKIRCHGAPYWQIQLQTEKVSCNYQPDSNAALLVLQIISA